MLLQKAHLILSSMFTGSPSRTSDIELVKSPHPNDLILNPPPQDTVKHV